MTAIVACNGLGYASAMVSGIGGTQATYDALVRPAWAPPPWLFGPAWTLLYTLMAVATWMIWRHTEGADRRRALGWFATQLALNLAWTPVFFGAQQIGASVVVIVANLIAVAITAIDYRRRLPLAGWLLAPLFAWVAFATALNVAIWVLNR